ncbi:MAG: hypothetical protein WA118_13095 [Carboxydocellales bacterium]
MTKMYNEMQKGFTDLRENQAKLEKDFREGQVKLENELKEAKETLFDGYKHTCEKLEVLENKVDKLTTTVESHDV